MGDTAETHRGSLNRIGPTVLKPWQRAERVERDRLQHVLALQRTAEPHTEIRAHVEQQFVVMRVVQLRPRSVVSTLYPTGQLQGGGFGRRRGKSAHAASPLRSTDLCTLAPSLCIYYRYFRLTLDGA